MVERSARAAGWRSLPGVVRVAAVLLGLFGVLLALVEAEQGDLDATEVVTALVLVAAAVSLIWAGRLGYWIGLAVASLVAMLLLVVLARRPGVAGAVVTAVCALPLMLLAVPAARRPRPTTRPAPSSAALERWLGTVRVAGVDQRAVERGRAGAGPDRPGRRPRRRRHHRPVLPCLPACRPAVRPRAPARPAAAGDPAGGQPPRARHRGPLLRPAHGGPAGRHRLPGAGDGGLRGVRRSLRRRPRGVTVAGAGGRGGRGGVLRGGRPHGRPSGLGSPLAGPAHPLRRRHRHGRRADRGPLGGDPAGAGHRGDDLCPWSADQRAAGGHRPQRPPGDPDRPPGAAAAAVEPPSGRRHHPAHPHPGHRPAAALRGPVLLPSAPSGPGRARHPGRTGTRAARSAHLARRRGTAEETLQHARLTRPGCEQDLARHLAGRAPQGERDHDLGPGRDPRVAAQPAGLWSRSRARSWRGRGGARAVGGGPAAGGASRSHDPPSDERLPHHGSRSRNRVSRARVVASQARAMAAVSDRPPLASNSSGARACSPRWWATGAWSVGVAVGVAGGIAALEAGLVDPQPRKSSPLGKNHGSAVSPPATMAASSLAIQAPPRGVEEVVPGPVEGVGGIGAAAVAADLDHLGPPGQGLVRLGGVGWRPTMPPARSTRSGPGGGGR